MYHDQLYLCLLWRNKDDLYLNIDVYNRISMFCTHLIQHHVPSVAWLKESLGASPIYVSKVSWRRQIIGISRIYVSLGTSVPKEVAICHLHALSFKWAMDLDSIGLILQVMTFDIHHMSTSLTRVFLSLGSKFILG